MNTVQDFYNEIGQILVSICPDNSKKIIMKCKEAHVVLTGAGAAYPYGRDPKDTNIRIAPSFPTPEELEQAAKLFVLCVKLVTVEKLLEA